MDFEKVVKKIEPEKTILKMLMERAIK